MARPRKFLLLFYFIHMTCAAVINSGSCPESKLIDRFDLTKFGSGQWYQIARYPDDFEKTAECIKMNPSIEDGSYKFNATEIVNGRLNLVQGYITADKDKPGLIYLHSPSMRAEEVDNKFPVHIVFADYDNFFFAYDCRYNETTNKNHEYAWLWARSKVLEGEAKKEFDELLKSQSYIDNNKLVWEHFSHEYCDVTA